VADGRQRVEAPAWAAGEGLAMRRTMQLLLREGREHSAWNRETIARTEAGTLCSHGRLAQYRASACVTGGQDNGGWAG
jgi:hypothetical protein